MRRLALAFAWIFLLASCSPDAAPVALAIDDPLALIDDVVGPLRLLVVPSSTHSCDVTSGLLSPDIADVPEGMVSEAVADVSLDIVSSSARGEVQVPAGDYVVLVRGKGTDPVTGAGDVFIATGCANASVGAGETIEVRIALVPIFGMGVCGDSMLTPDEQCDDSNAADGDGCSASCRSETIAVNTTTTGTQDRPSVAGASDQRWSITYGSGALDVFIRLLEPDGSAVASPSVLLNDDSLRNVGTGLGSGVHRQADVAVAVDGRIAISFVAAQATSDLRVAFFTATRSSEGTSVVLRDGVVTQAISSLAFAADGTLFVVFEDPMSTSGLSGQMFAPGSRAPLAAAPFLVAVANGAAPSVAAASDHFIVAFTVGAEVLAQRFGLDGIPIDEFPIPVAAGGTQSEPSIAALAGGTVLVAWREEAADASGSAIRARVLGGGVPLGEAFVLNTTTAGDQSAPAAAAGENAFVVAFTSDASVRARLLGAMGAPIANREQPPTITDFEIAAAGTQPAIGAGGPNGARWMAAWNEAGDIRARLFPLP